MPFGLEDRHTFMRDLRGQELEAQTFSCDLPPYHSDPLDQDLPALGAEEDLSVRRVMVPERMCHMPSAYDFSATAIGKTPPLLVQSSSCRKQAGGQLCRHKHLVSRRVGFAADTDAVGTWLFNTWARQVNEVACALTDDFGARCRSEPLANHEPFQLGAGAAPLPSQSSVALRHVVFSMQPLPTQLAPISAGLPQVVFAPSCPVSQRELAGASHRPSLTAGDASLDAQSQRVRRLACTAMSLLPRNAVLGDSESVGSRDVMGKGFYVPRMHPAAAPVSRAPTLRRPTDLQVLIAENTELRPDTIRGPFKYNPVDSVRALLGDEDCVDNERYTVFDPTFHFRGQTTRPRLECN